MSDRTFHEAFLEALRRPDGVEMLGELAYTSAEIFGMGFTASDLLDGILTKTLEIRDWSDDPRYGFTAEALQEFVSRGS